jgi:murein DD-endopeptidase MepM/ murein hydrolase activator NlpD
MRNTALGAGLLAVLLCLAPARAGSGSPVTRLKQKLDSIIGRITGKKKEIRHTQTVKRQVGDNLEESQERLDEAKGQLAASREKLAAAREAVADATRRLEEARARLKLQQHRFGQRIASTYTEGSVNYVDVLLGARDYNDFLDRKYYVEKIAERDSQILGALRQAQGQVARERAGLVGRQQALAAVNAEIAQREEELAQRTSEQQQLLARLKVTLQQQQQELDDLEQDSRAVEEALRREMAGRAVRRRQHPGTYRELPPWTGFSMPARGPITSGFGMRFHPILHYTRMHTGIDIAVGYGHPINAAAAGEVFCAGWRGGYGKCIIILHGGGVSTLYGHCSRLVVSPGQRVRRGQLIGYVGSTGLSTAPHLHFEVRRNGRPVNPL